MSVATRIGLFGAGLVVLFGTAFAAGDALDPDVDDPQPTAHGASTHARAGDAPAPRPARIEIADVRFDAGEPAPLRFRVLDGAGRTVEDFDVEHEREMHVIAVRRDLTGYRHVHPRRTADGGWAVDVAFSEPGPHRVYADFASGGKPYTLAADVEVAGRYAARGLPAPATTADAGDGYRADLVRDGDERHFSVTRDGRPVDDIEPYLGARGHLVAIAAGDLAFQHVHPQDRAVAGREIGFDVALERPGRYRLFLQFKHGGAVRTAAFTEDVGKAAGRHEDGGDHGH